MNKKLPKVFQNHINNINNNMNVYTSKFKEEESNVDNICINDIEFNKLYEIKTYDNTYVTVIVSKINDHLLTKSNVIIKLKDIISIKRKDR